MKTGLAILIMGIAFCGCSTVGGGVAPDGEAPTPPASRQGQTMHWTWHAGLYRVSEDHRSIERIPNREADYHLNVNRFVEFPFCDHCFAISKPDIQPDGTMKVDVTLSHPFPDQPEYTGFNVRGTVMFHATRYWKREPGGWYTKKYELIFEDFVPFYFSLARDGGGELLNADAFTMYFFPGMHIPGFNGPIFNYKKGKHALGPDPDSTINGYKAFYSEPDRRMFLVTDTITRTYHIAPPQGAFFFGYVVDACWAQPTVMPVTDPKNDFPFWANCEDGFIMEFEQLQPFKTGTYDGPVPYPGAWDITSVIIQIYHADDISEPHNLFVHLLCPDITQDPFLQARGIAYSDPFEKLYPDKYIVSATQQIRKGTYEAEPGWYPAVLMVRFHDYFPALPQCYWPIQIQDPMFFQIFELEVIAGD